MQEKHPSENGGRDWSDVCTGRTTPRTASSHQKLGDRREEDTVSEPAEATKSHRHPAFRLLTSRTVREGSFWYFKPQSL